jgi:hypothetical protein
MGIKRLAFNALEKALYSAGYRLTRIGEGYLRMKETVRAAQAQGQTVCEYLETLWDEKGVTARVIDEMSRLGCLVPCDVVMEVGPGTGRYLEPILQRTSPRRYEIYETAKDWARWLSKTYSPAVVWQPTDGRTLQPTPSGTCGLVHAHGVLVYVSLLNAFEYLAEMVRVCAPGGYIVFDFFSAETFDETVIARWLRTPDRYPVVIAKENLRSFLVTRDCEPIHEFEIPFGHSHSQYVIYRKC